MAGLRLDWQKVSVKRLSMCDMCNYFLRDFNKSYKVRVARIA